MSAPNTRTLARVALALVAIGGVISTLVWAGPLDPPSGAVSSTYKTLTEVEPRVAISSTNTPGDADSLYKITQPGSYYLTGNITAVLGRHGIEIAASGVTIDLSGFDLVGSTAFPDYAGIRTAAPSLRNITIRNGSVRNWGGEGVDLASNLAWNCSIEGVRASNNAGTGIDAGAACTLTDCSGVQNAGFGIDTRGGSTLVNCSAYENGYGGIRTALAGTLMNCSAWNNSVAGFLIDDGSTASNCSATSNDGVGFYVGRSSTLANCSASTNAGTGFDLEFGCTLSGCSACDNSQSGVDADGGCNVSNCVVQGNDAIGLVVTSYSVVTDCTVQYNYSDGILCLSYCVIRGNACSTNSFGGDGAGIHTTGTDNRIESNNCINADRGIDVDTAGNVIIKNTCSGNTVNWDIVAGNALAPIVSASTNAVPVSGNTYAGTLGSTDPNANFTY
ncbi:MAG: right-handed parallel beta-helix repeat-containing protein [Phycisphaerales bacterium]|nr:right-handed parallel beta-helix repeat-containing protein [Phycisphaerales bacterium]